MRHLSSSWLKASSLLIAVALILSACNDAAFTPITTNDPVAEIAAGLTLSVNPAEITSDFGVQLSAIPAETFAAGQAGSEWSKALASLPANLQLLSPVYEIRTKGTNPAQLFVAVIVPGSANAAAADLYAWDGKQWSFLPATLRGAQLVASVTKAPRAVALFGAGPLPPLAFTTLEPGQTLTAAAAGAVNAVLVGGIAVQPNGTLAGQLPAIALDQPYSVYPIIRNYAAAGGATAQAAALVTDAVLRASQIQQLTAFAASSNYAGLVLDYRSVGAEVKPLFSSFVNELADKLHAENKSLLVQVGTPTASASSYDAAGYDLPALGAAADALLLPVADDPTAYGTGAADALLAWATGQVNRGRLRLVTSALNVDGVNGGFALRDLTTALAPLGTVALAPNAPTSPYLGQTITVTLSSKATMLDYDPTAFATRYTYTDDGGATHTVWLTSAGTLRQRLALAEKYRLGGVVVADLFTSGVSDDLVTAINQYKVNLTAEAQTQASLLWAVKDPSGAVAQATTQPGQSFAYAAQTPGTYEFSAVLQSGSTLTLGSVPLTVANVTATPVPRYTYTGGGTTSSGSSGSSTTDAAPPAPIAAGIFELGGQVPGYISHPTQMQQAHMKWVKFQARGGQDASGFIAAGHANGFKVLISALGDHSRATDPSYLPEYSAWVAGMAAQGADAIEIWNEMNIDAEWPTGQISAASYMPMLQQAYTAIKAANSGTMVISGALAPTGVEAIYPGRVVNDDHYLADMNAAGAANYMDCVGVHYNQGTTPPSATSGGLMSGYHYSYYFWPMVDVYYNAFGGARPLCFTELGFLTPEGYGSILNPNFAWAGPITVANQASWLAEAASLAGNSGKVRLMVIWNVDFTQWDSFFVHGGYAMVRPDGSCPACSALGAVVP